MTLLGGISMAIITCPECKEKISDTSKNCIHCGCQINLCPECKNINTNSTQVCAFCGYQFENKEEAGQKNKETNIVDKFLRIFDIIGCGGIIIGVICLVVAYAKLQDWANFKDAGEAFEGLMNYREVKSSIITLIIFAFVFLGLVFTAAFLEPIIFWLILETKQDVSKNCFLKIKALNEEIQSTTDKKVEAKKRKEMKRLTKLMIYKTNTKEKSKILIESLITSIVFLLVVLFSYLHLKVNLENYMSIVLTTNDLTKFAYDNNYTWMLLLALTIGIIVLFVTENRHNKQLEEWYKLIEKKYKEI